MLGPSRPIVTSLLLVAAAGATTAVVPLGGIQWEDSFDLALERADAEGKVVFIAVNMDGEAANERAVKSVYTDRALTALTGHTANVIASADRHSRSGACKRFGCISCDVHQEADIEVRERILKPDATGAVIAPQHVFLSPAGDVLLSVPYEVSAKELAWCFGEAFERAGVTDAPDVPAGARRPRRLIIGDVASLGRRNRAPLTKEAVEELIALLRKGTERSDRNSMIQHLATADEDEAREYVLSLLRSGGGRGGGGRRGGGGGGRNGSERERAALLRWIGTASPVSYAEVVEPFIDAGTVDARSEAIVALEQLASEDSVKALLGALKKAKDETIEKNLLRAIGACGPGDRKVRSALLKASEDVKNPLARQNALLALGWAENDEGVSERLRQAVLPEEFAKKSKIGPDRITELEREAAVVAMGISRDEAWTEMLTRIREDEEEPQELRDAASASLEVIAGGEYRLLRDALMRAGSDEIPRDRLFRAAGRERRR
ncbi:MAG: hypothetical protein VX460_10190 [Planctomycetota bacterium]|nr:hypothetical protein [Planctomycetota bacterium]